MTDRFISHAKNEDQALFLLVKNRNKDAFTRLFNKYHAYLYALSLRYLKNREMAEDTVQHVFIKLWETSSNIEIEINVKNYLYTMTKNHILNLIRDNKETIALNYANAQQEIEDTDDFIDSMEKKQMIEMLH